MKRIEWAAAGLAASILALGAGQAAASPVLLSELIGGGGSLTVGDLSFGGFLAGAPNTVDPTLVQVSAIMDSLGRASLQFSAPLSITNGGGSKEIDADFLFTVTDTASRSVLHDLTQAITADVSGSGISAFDFTRAGSPGSLLTLAGNCVNGDVAGCPQIIGPTDTGLMGDVASDQVERDVQLVRNRGGTGTGNLTSWTVAFGETGLTSAVPEPSAWLLMISGMAGVGLVARRRRARLATA
jgi:hypothetical protein